MATMSGKRGGIQLTDVLRIIERYAYKQRYVAWNKAGVQKGLPPDVVTVMIGTPEEGFHWNVRRGMIPEYNIREKEGRIEDNEEVLEDLKRLGMASPGWQPGSQSMFGEHNLKKRYKPKLLYIGWRGWLKHLLIHRKIRDNEDVEELLGTFDYTRTIQTRQRWDESMAEAASLS